MISAIQGAEQDWRCWEKEELGVPGSGWHVVVAIDRVFRVGLIHLGWGRGV